MLLTVKDLQKKLPIGRDRAYELMHSAGFPSMKLGGRYYVLADELEKWLKQYAYKEFVF